MTLFLRQRLVDVAVAELGVKETDGPNDGPEVVKYQLATYLAPGPWPWCAAFVAWCIREWAQAPDVRRALRLSPESPPPAATLEQWRFKSPRAFDFESWGAQHGCRVLGEGELALLGDVITFDFSHIGIVRQDEVPGRPILTVEGNTNDAGSRDGNAVALKSRTDSLTRRYIRLLEP